MPEKPNADTEIDRLCTQPQDEPGKPAAAGRLPRGAKTIVIPFVRKTYPVVVKDPPQFRQVVDDFYARHPEAFPAAMSGGYKLHDTQVSAKLGIALRRIKLVATGEVYGIHPAFVMPYLVGLTTAVEPELFLAGFGVPLWALTSKDNSWFASLTRVVLTRSAQVASREL